MTYKAEFDFLLHFQSISTLLFRNQGLVKIRAFIFQENATGEQLHAHPYSIIKSKPSQHAFDSYIDETSHGYCSRSVMVSYQPDEYPLQQACLFRAYIPVDLLDHLTLSCTVQLLFSPDLSESQSSTFQVLGCFKCRITKPSRLAEYLPITFDQYEGCTVKATYHSTILEFRFMRLEEDEDEDQGYGDFGQYLEASTMGFRKPRVQGFYGYYRNSIEDEFAALQDMFAQLRNVTGDPPKPKLRFIRNCKLQNDIDRLLNPKSITAQTIDQLIESIMQQFTTLKGVCYKYWNEYIEYVMQRSSKIAQYYRQSYRQRVLERFKTNVFSYAIKGKDWTIARYNDYGQTNLVRAQNQRNKSYEELWAEEFPIQNIEYFPDPHKTPKIFEQSYSIAPSLSKSQNMPLLHVFVLVHGFQASHKDFSILKNYLLARQQPTQILLSVINQGRTSFNIQALGSRLAFQVSDFLQSRLNKHRFRLSFIGHSLGGIIIRTALRHLQRFWPCLYSYISFSSPHLGYLNPTSKVIEAGLWYLNSWEKCDSIRQLMMRDSEDILKTFMFRLAQQDVFRHFRNVALVSSYQDGFVGHESARVEKSLQMINQAKVDKNAAVLCRMVDNILTTNIRNLCRIDVAFAIDEKNIDSLLGRTGHIKFLSDSNFLKIFVNTFDHLFK